MQRFIVVAIVLVLLAIPAFGATRTVQASLSWDGKDASGAIEPSLPVTVEIFDATTNVLKSTLNISGPVTNQAMPTWTVDVPDNGSVTVSVYATAKDSAGNKSPHSATVTKTVYGADTIAPGTPVITITIP